MDDHADRADSPSNVPTRREFLGYTAGGLAGLAAVGGTLHTIGATEQEQKADLGTADEHAAYQYFHTPWAEIESDLERVADAGIKTIWVPQPSESKLSWEDQATEDQEGFYEDEHPYYGHLEPHPPLGYQPVDLRNFDSAYGTEAELESLIETAHDHDIEVVLDTVLNHMANPPGPEGEVDWPQFDEDEHFHDYGTLGGDCELVGEEAEYECDLLGLPTLDLEHPEVQAAHRDYLERIAAVGADGLRYDAAGHIWPWYFQDEINPLADELGLWRVGEIWDHNIDRLLEFAETGMTVFDFPLHDTIQSVFDGGRMTQLAADNEPGVVHHRPEVAVTFAQNHDINGPGVGPDDSEGVEIDLAHAYLLAYEGKPMLFRADLDDPALQDLIRVQNEYASGPAIDRYVDDACYVFEREGNLLAGINIGDEPHETTVETSWTELELVDQTDTGEDVTVDTAGEVSLEIPAEGWVMYTPLSS